MTFWTLVLAIVVATVVVPLVLSAAIGLVAAIYLVLGGIYRAATRRIARGPFRIVRKP